MGCAHELHRLAGVSLEARHVDVQLHSSLKLLPPPVITDTRESTEVPPVSTFMRRATVVTALSKHAA